MSLKKNNLKKMLAVQASAGTGKTFALSVRYITLLLMGVSPRSIFALTFTNKAASEMEHRVINVISNPTKHKNELKHIALTLGLKESTIYQKMLKLRKTFSSEENHIVTIDAFTNQMLRTFANNLGITSDFKIGDVDKYQKAIEFYRFVKEKNELNSLFDFIDGTNKKFETLIDTFQKFESYHNELAIPLAELAISGTQQNFAITVKNIELSIKEKLEYLVDFISSLNYTKSMITPFSDFDTVEALSEKSVFSRDTLNYKTFSKIWSNELDEFFLDIKNTIKEYYIAKEQAFLVNTAYLYMYFNEVSMELRQKQNLMTFDDVLKIVFDIMQSNDNNFDYIKFKLDSKIEHILIDEFQDTSWVQYKILEPLISEIASSTEFKTFFLVGDIKQSIYRFRGGNSSLFNYVKNKFEMQSDTLDVNFRSSMDVIDFNNKIFSDIYPDFVVQQYRDNASAGNVSVNIATDAIQDTADSVLEMINSGVFAKDIAVLVYTNDEVLHMANAITEKDPDIQVITETNSKLIHNRNVMAISNALKYVFFNDEFSFKSFLSIVGKNDSEDLFRKLLFTTAEECFSLSDAPGLYLTSFIEKLGLFLGDLNVVKLIEIAYRYDFIEEFISELSYLTDPVVNIEEQNGVRIITIHKSKGLEFENVFIVDKEELISGSGNDLFFDFDDNINVQKIWKRTTKRSFFDNEYAEAIIREKSRDLRDAHNVAYVAFTRAKHNLSIFCYPEKSKLSNIPGLLSHCAEYDIKHQEEQRAEED